MPVTVSTSGTLARAASVCGGHEIAVALEIVQALPPSVAWSARKPTAIVAVTVTDVAAKSAAFVSVAVTVACAFSCTGDAAPDQYEIDAGHGRQREGDGVVAGVLVARRRDGCREVERSGGRSPQRQRHAARRPAADGAERAGGRARQNGAGRAGGRGRFDRKARWRRRRENDAGRLVRSVVVDVRRLRERDAGKHLRRLRQPHAHVRGADRA